MGRTNEAKRPRNLSTKVKTKMIKDESLMHVVGCVVKQDRVNRIGSFHLPRSPQIESIKEVCPAVCRL